MTFFLVDKDNVAHIGKDKKVVEAAASLTGVPAASLTPAAAAVAKDFLKLCFNQVVDHDEPKKGFRK